MHPSANKAIVAIIFVAAGFGTRADMKPNPYAGLQERTIKSLSDAEVAGLLAGNGAGYAKTAELNGYPGPAHVLELAKDLQLDDAQLAATRRLMDAHKARAIRLGAALVSAERELDSLFAHKRADPEAVDRATERVGMLQAQVRAEHLKTHLDQTALLNSQQLQRYSSLRGYSAPQTSDTQADAPAHSSHQH